MGGSIHLAAVLAPSCFWHSVGSHISEAAIILASWESAVSVDGRVNL